jgi:GNAT superfamily N-acetyltransferase
LHIRQSDDVDTVRELHRIAFASSAAALKDDELEGSAWWIAEDNDVPVAFAGATCKMDGVFLIRAGVIPGLRGSGLQKRLIRVRLRWAKRQGATRAYTYTAINNYPSMRALISTGFKPYTSTRRDDGSFLYFEKPLTPASILGAGKHHSRRLE